MKLKLHNLPSNVAKYVAIFSSQLVHRLSAARGFQIWYLEKWIWIHEHCHCSEHELYISTPHKFLVILQNLQEKCISKTIAWSTLYLKKLTISEHSNLINLLRRNIKVKTWASFYPYPIKYHDLESPSSGEKKHFGGQETANKASLVNFKESTMNPRTWDWGDCWLKFVHPSINVGLSRSQWDMSVNWNKWCMKQADFQGY